MGKNKHNSNSLEARMKQYEAVSKNKLVRRVPAVIRLDGKAFHTFTRGMHKPYDDILMETMQLTLKELCENIQGCVFGYTQSDEITLVLTDYDNINTDAWFGYSIQKVTSISASMATLYFNRIFRTLVNERKFALQAWDTGGVEQAEANIKEEIEFIERVYEPKFDKALFDSRVFNLPVDEVANNLIWRQQDATRNSIEAAGQAKFSASQLHKKSQSDIQEMLFNEHGINWNNYPTTFKRGTACYKKVEVTPGVDAKNGDSVEIIRRKWFIDTEIPIFTQDREFITNRL